MKFRLLSIITIAAACIFLLSSSGTYAQLPFAAPSAPSLQSPAQSPGLSNPATPQTSQMYQSSDPSQPMSVQGMTPRQADMFQRMTPQQQTDILQRMTPEQIKAAEGFMQNNRGALTPEAIEALKSRPEFKGLKPEDIIKGKELLEKKDAANKEFEKTLTPMEKRVIGATDDTTLFDRMRKIGKYQDISTTLKPFGYEFFKESDVTVVTERKDIPVPTQYIIGPSDEVKILFWGRVNAQHNLIVDRNGNITIPQMGPIKVAGMTFEEMSKQLITQSQQIVGTNIDITMGSLKTIPIFVLGDARRPGSYTIGSFSTITDALLMAGGPTGIGTMRNVQLKRKGKLITTFDLYDLLLKGDKSKDLILQAGDVVFVPVSGPLVGIAGNVKRPAIYELKDKTDLHTLFLLAGDIIPAAYTQQIQVERIIKTERQMVIDINDKDLTKSKQFLLQDADLVKVFNIVDKETNVVFLYGNVKRPGKYEFQPGMRMKGLVKDQSAILPETYLDYALIRRTEPPNFETRVMPFSLNDLFAPDGKANIELKPMDAIYIFSKWFFKDKPYIKVEGEVRGSIITDFETTRLEELSKPLGMGSTSDMLDLRPEEMRELGLTDINQKKLDEIRKTSFSDIDEMKFGELRAKGIIKIDQKKLDDIKKAGIINIDNVKLGDLRKQGALTFLGIDDSSLYVKRKSVEIPLKANMTIKDAILAAGGLTKDAYMQEAELYRTDNATKRVTSNRFSLKKALDGDIENNVLLKDKDRVVIQSIWGYEYKKTLDIDGEVLNPGT